VADTKKRNVDLIGKIARFPNNVKASKAYSFLENIKINRNKIWYILVEKQDNELQMLKYNIRSGVDLSQFIVELKAFYLDKFAEQPKIHQIIEKLEIYGEDKFVVIKNIPRVELAGKKLISRLTEDLIKLLSK
jgi:hypothetical protein